MIFFRRNKKTFIALCLSIAFLVVGILFAWQTFLAQTGNSSADFRSFVSDSSTYKAIVARFGEPEKDIGSGLHIYVYKTSDGKEIWVGTTSDDAPVMFVYLVDSTGKQEPLVGAIDT
jgi:hypothetical protein